MSDIKDTDISELFLENCPLCDAPAKKSWGKDNPTWREIRCSKSCHFSSSPSVGGHNTTYKKLAVIWNTRPKQQRLESELTAAQERITELEKLVYVPGVLKCVKCKFSCIKTALHAPSGNFSADNSPEHCANGCGPMWKVSERDAGNQLIDDMERLNKKYQALRARVEKHNASMHAHRNGAYLISLGDSDE